MKIAILGGGFGGLSAAFYLNQKGHEVTLFEKEQILGGLAVGFKGTNWDWYLERTYHHLFSNDYDIRNFAKEIGFSNINFYSPETASLYEMSDVRSQMSEIKQISNISHQSSVVWHKESNNFRIIPVDTPQDFLKFPLLSLPVKIRAAFVLAFLKFSPFLTLYEKYTAEEFLRRTQGEKMWNVFWREMMRKKFGKYAGNILASFIWARITKRTKELGYVQGGFQRLINHAEKELEKEGVVMKRGFQIGEIRVQGLSFIVHGAWQGTGEQESKRTTEQESKRAREQSVISAQRKASIESEIFDVVISTLPTPVLVKITPNLLPQNYSDKLKKIQFLHAVNIILETEKPILDKTYWLNVCTPKLPMMVVVQHTNMIGKRHFNNHHIAYCGNYIDSTDPLVKMPNEEVLNHYLPYLKQVAMNDELKMRNYYVFKAPFAQPIFDREFLKNKPEFITPVKNFFIANLDMTYPYDRGTNYAVKLGKEVSQYI